MNSPTNNWGRDEPNIGLFFLWKLKRTSQHGTKNVKTHTMTYML